MYKAIDLSHYVVRRCIDNNRPITNLYLQYILYYIQEAFVKQDKVAFADDIESWSPGPVVPSVYYYFGGTCGWGCMSITSDDNEISIDSRDRIVIDYIIDKYSIMKFWDLTKDAGMKDSAYSQTYEVGEKRVIPLYLMKEKI